jgi:plastocyanin
MMTRAVILILITILALGGLFFALRPDPPAEGPQERTVDVEIRGDAMEPAEIAVDEGDEVTLRVTSDRPVELHLHGYDRELEVEPGETAELSFEATLTGRFEIEDHQTGEELGTLVVQPRTGG